MTSIANSPTYTQPNMWEERHSRSQSTPVRPGTGEPGNSTS
jgi:hypothetical protein